MPAYIIMIFISLIASVTALSVKDNRNTLKYFPFFLAITFLVEYFSWKIGNAQHTNIFIYNLFSVVEFAFYLFFLRFIIYQFNKSNIILYSILAYLALIIINIFFIQGRNLFHTYTYILGSLFIVILCIIYLNFLFRYTKASNLISMPVFWLVSGLLFSFTFSLPVFGIINFVAKIPTHFERILRFMVDFMNIMLYLLFTIGFLCRINIRKLLRSS